MNERASMKEHDLHESVRHEEKEEKWVYTGFKAARSTPAPRGSDFSRFFLLLPPLSRILRCETLAHDWTSPARDLL